MKIRHNKLGEVTVPDEWGDAQIKEYIRGELQRADPTRGMTGGQRFFAGAGSALAQTGRGIGQLTGMLSNDEVRAAMERDKPLLNTGAGLAGNITGHIGTMLGPAAALKAAGAPALGAQLMAPSTLPRAAAVGGLYGGIQEAEDTGDRLKNVALGAAGGAVGQKAGQAVAGVARAGGAAKKAIGEAAERLGFRLTPAERIASAPGRLIEHTAESFPPTAGPFRALKERNQTVANEIAGKAMGLDGVKEISDEVLSQAESTIGKKFDLVAGVGDIPLEGLLPKVEAAAREYRKGWGRNLPASIKRMLKDARLAADEGFSGKDYITVRSKLSKDMNTQMTSAGGDRSLGEFYGDVIEKLDDVAESAMPDKIITDYKKARQQWQNYLNVAKKREGLDFRKLDRKTMDQYRKRASKGALDDETQALYDASRFVDVYRALVGDSGTASRMVAPVATAGMATGGMGMMQGGFTPETLAAGAAILPAMWGASQAYMRQPGVGMLGNVMSGPMRQAFRSGATAGGTAGLLGVGGS